MRRRKADALRAIALAVGLAGVLGCSTRQEHPQQAQSDVVVDPAGESSRSHAGASTAADTLEAADRPSDAPPPPAAAPPLPPGYMGFAAACDPGPSVVVAAVGDVLLHPELQRQAYRSPDGFSALWTSIDDLLSRADVTYGNLEVPIAAGVTERGQLVADPGPRFDDRVYTGYPRFNAHPSLAAALARSGFDVVSTANNHALDRDGIGVDRTLDALDAAGLLHTGTRRRGSDEPWHTVTETSGIRIAWLACTVHTNYGVDTHGQVLHCFEDPDAVPRLVSELRASPEIDAIIVTPHIGNEYDPVPSDEQRAFARAVLDAGATAVLGAHPHVLQPWERYVTKDGRETFVLYSLGNFVSHQRSLPRRSTMLLYLGLRKTSDGVVPYGVGYVPLHVRMEGRKWRFFVEAVDRVGGPADARALVVEMFGELNVVKPDAAIDLAPQCKEEWSGWSQVGAGVE